MMAGLEILSVSEPFGERSYDPKDSDAVAKRLQAYERAVAWNDAGHYHATLSELYFSAAEVLRGQPGANPYPFLERAAYEAREGLLRNPAQPRQWTILAAAAVQTRGLQDDFSGLLKQAILADPIYERLVFLRTDLGLRTWPRLDEQTKGLVAQQLLLAMEAHPVRVGRMITGPNQARLVRSLLSKRSDLLASFNRWSRH